ncbi:MAG: glycosyltransferase [Actinomycetota bacterium]|nr:glycosyltransferase [Actinomycetota bacterium]
MRVLCTCLPGFGHFNPLVPLARALVVAGHEVAFATAANFCPRVEQAGFPAFAAGMNLGEQLEVAARRYPDFSSLPMGKERFETFVPRMLAGVAAPARADDLVPLVARWRPDLILHDEAEFAAPVAAAVAGIPHASQSIVQLRPWSMALFAGRELTPLAARWGVDVGPHGGLYRYLHFDSCPPSLQAPHIVEVAVAHPLRNTEDLDTASGDVLPPWVDGLPARPTVYVTLGTVFNRDPAVFSAILKGLGGMGVNVIATIGHGHDPAQLGPQPESVHVARYIPLSMLLPRLDVVVTQGGTSILPALGRGLPLLLLPQGADQFHNAEACVAAGVGRRLLPTELHPGAVRREVELLLSDGAFATRARGVRAEIESMPGPGVGVQLLERLARERQPIQRAGP